VSACGCVMSPFVGVFVCLFVSQRDNC